MSAALLDQLEENRFYDIQLTVCEARERLRVLNGKVFKKKESEPLYTIKKDNGYNSDGEVVEIDTYTYTFYNMRNEPVGTLVQKGRYLYLKYNEDGNTVRVGCSIKIKKAFLF